MTPFRFALRGHKITWMSREGLWGRAHHAFARVERVAQWLKVYAWKRSFK